MTEFFNEGYALAIFLTAVGVFMLGWVLGEWHEERERRKEIHAITDEMYGWMQKAINYRSDAEMLHRSLSAAVVWGLKIPPKGCRARAARTRNEMEKTLTDVLEVTDAYRAGN